MGYEQDFETPLLCLYSMSLVMVIFILILENILVSGSLVFLCLSLFVFLCYHLHFINNCPLQMSYPSMNKLIFVKESYRIIFFLGF